MVTSNTIVIRIMVKSPKTGNINIFASTIYYKLNMDELF